MLGNFKIKKQMNRLRGQEDQQFILSFRQKLSHYVASHPADQTQFSLPYATRWSYALVSVILLILGAGGTALASLGSMPGEALYPVKIAMENFQVATSFRSETKAKLQIDHASKRLLEAEHILADEGIDEGKLDVAAEEMEKNLAKAEVIVSLESHKGSQVSSTTKTYNSQIKELKKRYKNKLTEKEKKLLERMNDLGSIADKETNTKRSKIKESINKLKERINKAEKNDELDAEEEATEPGKATSSFEEKEPGVRGRKIYK